MIGPYILYESAHRSISYLRASNITTGKNMARRSDRDTIVQRIDTCRDASELIVDYLNGELNEYVELSFEKHLARCPDCVSFLNTYKKTVELTKSFMRSK